MKILSVFNNKGGVGKTTLTFHLAQALSAMGKKVLMLDADPQCNLTIYSISVDQIHKIWAQEDECLDVGLEEFKRKNSTSTINKLHKNPRSIHYLLQPTIEGTGEYKTPPPGRTQQKSSYYPRATLHPRIRGENIFSLE